LENLRSNTLTWSDITYPIFPLAGTVEGFYKEEDILFAKDDRGYRILDDTTLEGNSLGVRRLKIKADRKSIYPLKRKIDTFIDLVKYSAKSKLYLDYTGKPFKYKKTRYVSLVYKPINFRKYVDGKGTLFTAKGVNNWFEVPAIVGPEIPFVILLKIDQSYVLYGLSNTKGLDTRRMI
jgi:hypothetical protein